MNLSYNSPQFVDSDGPVTATVLLIGEAPGQTELITNKPFSGRGGKLLRAALFEFAHLSTDSNLYITNSVRFNPPKNRKPTSQELNENFSFLVNEITTVNPRLIVLCGATAHTNLLKTKFQNEALSSFQNYKTYTIFHPAYILRNYSKLPIYQKSIQKIIELLE